MTGNNPLPTASLRPWTDRIEDIEAVLEAFNSEDMAGQSAEPINSEAAARRWLEPWVRTPDSSAVAFAIDVNGVAVGNVMATAIDRRNDTAWVSYWVTHAARGSGLAAKATAALAKYCFKDLGLYRLELAHRANNPSSGRVAVKAGFVREGLERGKLRYLDAAGQPVRYDVLTYARLIGDPAPEITVLPIRS